MLIVAKFSADAERSRRKRAACPVRESKSTLFFLCARCVGISPCQERSYNSQASSLRKRRCTFHAAISRWTWHARRARRSSIGERRGRTPSLTRWQQHSTVFGCMRTGSADNGRQTALSLYPSEAACTWHRWRRCPTKKHCRCAKQNARSTDLFIGGLLLYRKCRSRCFLGTSKSFFDLSVSSSPCSLSFGRQNNNIAVVCSGFIGGGACTTPFLIVVAMVFFSECNCIIISMSGRHWSKCQDVNSSQPCDWEIPYKNNTPRKVGNHSTKKKDLKVLSLT